MTDLRTSQDVINVSGVAALPEYGEIVAFRDPVLIGFSTKRDYPADSEIARVITARGRPDLCCLIHFTVPRLSVSGGVRRTRFRVMTFSRWIGSHPDRLPGEYDYADPDCPTAESVHLLSQLPKLTTLTDADVPVSFFYDTADGYFYNQDGVRVTGKYILDYLFVSHSRTRSGWVRLKDRASAAGIRSIRRAFRRSQNVAVWLLEHGYDIRPTCHDRRWYFVYTHLFSDFERVCAESNSHFFGFQSSKRSLRSNTFLLVLICLLAYLFLPRGGFFGAIYHSVPLTMVALVLVFLLLDLVVPALLKAVVCLAARWMPTPRDQ